MQCENSSERERHPGGCRFHQSTNQSKHYELHNKIKRADGVEREFKPFGNSITIKRGSAVTKFPVFTPGIQFYIDYKGAIRAAKIKGIMYSADYAYKNSENGTQFCASQIAYLYEIAGLGEELITNGITAYKTVEDYKAKTRMFQSKYLPYNDFCARIKSDLKGKFDVCEKEYKGSYYDSNSQVGLFFNQWTWDGTKAVSHEVQNFNLFYDGTAFSLIQKELIDGAFPSKELCEQANEIRVIEF